MRDGNPEAEPHTAAEAPAGQTFVFADLAGFTALTEAHGDEHAADLVGRFCAEVSEMLPEYGAERVKAMGDALMLPRDPRGRRRSPRTQDRRGGGRAAWLPRGQSRAPYRIRRVARERLVRRDREPGRARDTRAASGEVLLTDVTKLATRADLEQIQFVRRDDVLFKNVRRPVELWAAVPDGHASTRGRLEIDPVCRMAVAPERAAATIRRGDRTLYFCSQACATAFENDPGRH